jgi:hypothetical protein
VRRAGTITPPLPFGRGRPVTIGTECPHCESVFQVAPELVGKSMRCPNPDCREVFTVSGATAAPVFATPPAPAPSPLPSVGGNVTDYLPVVEAERIDPPTPERPVYDAEPIGVEVYDAEPVRVPVPKAAPLPPLPKAAALPPPPAARSPQVLDWSGAAEPPGGNADRAPARTNSRRDDDSDIPIRSRTRGGGLSGKVIFGSLVVLLLVVGGGIVTFLLLSKMKSEEQDATAAEALYKEGKYAEAKRKYESLTTDFPDSGDVPRYKFFAALSQAQADASSVTVKDDPSVAQRSLAAPIAEHGVRGGCGRAREEGV